MHEKKCAKVYRVVRILDPLAKLCPLFLSTLDKRRSLLLWQVVIAVAFQDRKFLSLLALLILSLRLVFDNEAHKTCLLIVGRPIAVVHRGTLVALGIASVSLSRPHFIEHVYVIFCGPFPGCHRWWISRRLTWRSWCDRQ